MSFYLLLTGYLPRLRWRKGFICTSQGLHGNGSKVVSYAGRDMVKSRMQGPVVATQVIAAPAFATSGMLVYRLMIKTL